MSGPALGPRALEAIGELVDADAGAFEGRLRRAARGLVEAFDVDTCTAVVRGTDLVPGELVTASRRGLETGGVQPAVARVEAHGHDVAVRLVLTDARRARFDDDDLETLGTVARLIARSAGAAVGRRNAQEALRASERRFRGAVEHAPLLVLRFDRSHTCTFAGGRTRLEGGIDLRDCVGRPLSDIDLVPFDRAGIADLIDCAFRTAEGCRTEILVQLPNREVWVDLWSVPDRSVAADVEEVLLFGLDITDRRDTEMLLLDSVRTDPLTGVANRASATDFLAELLGDPCSGQVVVCFVDLDGFKPVNDTLGHQAGDEVLVEVARRLVATTRNGDLVARFGGDEFLVIAGGGGSVDEAVLVDRIHASLSGTPMVVGGTEVRVGASVGVATGLPGQLDAEELLARADAAMYLAKQGNRERVGSGR